MLLIWHCLKMLQSCCVVCLDVYEYPKSFCSFIVVSLEEIMIAARKDSIGNIVEKLLLNFNMGGKIVNELMITRGQRRLYKPNYCCYDYTFTYWSNFYPWHIVSMYDWNFIFNTMINIFLVEYLVLDIFWYLVNIAQLFR